MRFPEGAATLEALKAENISQSDLERIVEICNQEAVFAEIANHATGGKTYELEHAKQFVEIGDEGWKKRKAFIFVSRNEAGEIVSAIDIKSNDSIAEVGFWADKNNPGYTTNALVALSKIAKKAGYKGLYGSVRLDNDRSAAVFRRSGWQEEIIEQDSKRIYRFSMLF